MNGLRIVPLELVEANQTVAAWHRHHQPCQGHRFSLGVIDQEGCVHGAVIVGRPVARLAGHPRQVAEVTRLVTDGSRNACSMLYAAAARAAQAMGFERIQTYILDTEAGTSLRASGWVCQGSAGGVSGSTPMANHAAPTNRPAQRHAGPRHSTRHSTRRCPCRGYLIPHQPCSDAGTLRLRWSGTTNGGLDE